MTTLQMNNGYNTFDSSNLYIGPPSLRGLRKYFNGDISRFDWLKMFLYHEDDSKIITFLNRKIKVN